jgi:putative aminophosphonate oxidoreductase
MLRSARSAALFRFPTRPLDRTDSPRAFWLREALAREDRIEPLALEGPTTADVCIVGGGFTGLWTALAIKRRSPSADVVVVEADLCGGGASGRNGGFAMTWWSKFPSLKKLCGTEAALELARRSERAVDDIGRFCAEQGIDAAFSQRGWLWTATNPEQVAAWDATISALEAAGVRPYQPLSRDEVAERTGSPVHLAGVYERSVATVQPALLARGLARAARTAGVRVFERSPMSSLQAGPVTRIVTPGGEVRADGVVLALNAWSARIPEVGQGLVVVASDMIATEPVPERLAQLGWTDGVAVSDSRRLINYYRRSDDGRVVFGKGGGDLALGARIGASFDHSPRRARDVHAQFRSIYPMLWDVPVAHSWRGPIDYSVSGVPFFCRLRDAPRVLVAAGFSGNGVGPSRVAGDIMADMALDGGDAGLPPALTRTPSTKLPPEPLRYIGGLAVRAAVARKEDREDLGRRAGPVTRALAALDPTSFVDRGPAEPSATAAR